MECLKLAPLYDVVGKESKGVFLDANDFTLGFGFIDFLYNIVRKLMEVRLPHCVY